MKHSIPVQSWNGVTRALHWSMAGLMLLQIAVGWAGQAMERSPAKVDVMTLHKSLGITLLLLVALRLLWRWTHDAPPPPANSRGWEIRAARAVHVSLYLLMIALPLSGWLAASAHVVPWKLWWTLPWPRVVDPDRGLYERAAEWHESLLLAFLVLMAAHVAAACWHHFVRRDGILAGMWRGTAR